MHTLHLTLKKKWFDMIDQAVKKEEYREIKDYWINRLLGLASKKIPYNKEYLKSIIPKNINAIEFSNGYSPASRKIIVECKGIDIGSAVPEWSDNWEGDVFRIHLGQIIERINF